MSLSQKLLQLREENQVNRKLMAELIGHEEHGLLLVEDGYLKSKIAIRNLAKCYCSVFGISFDQLILEYS